MTRRRILQNAGKWGLALVLLYPLFAFVGKKRYRPPIEVRIRERLAPGTHLIEPEFALFETGTGPMAVSRRCTHLGCILNYQEADDTFLCPCHQSRFSWDGKYLSGPARKNLPRYPVLVPEGAEGYVVEIPRG